METLKSLFSDQVIEAFGWTIFHSIWQALALLFVLIIVLFFMKAYSARIRYFVAYSALVAVLIWSVGTGIKAYNHAQKKQALKERLISSPDGMALEIKNLLENPDEKTIKTKTTSFKWLEFKARIQANFHIVFYLWLIGIVFFLVKMAGGLAALQRLTRQKNAPIDDKWLKLAEQLQDKLQLKQKVTILQSYLAKVPMIVGKLKPVILIPAELLTGLSQEQIEAIFAHELAHIKRNDYVLNILQSLIETLFFYHPAVWVIARIIRDEREHACDDIAVDITGDRLNYIKALASAQEFTLKNQYNAVAFAQSSGGLLTRVKRLKTMSNMKNKVTEGFFAAAIVFISLIMLSFTYSGEPRNLNDSFDVFENSSKQSILTPEELKPENVVFVKDTIKHKVKKRVIESEEISEDLETVLELAIYEEDEAMAAEILASVEEALKGIEWDEIQVDIEAAQAEIEALNMDSIMREAHIEIEAAQAEFDNLNFDSIMREARAEIDAELKELKAQEKALGVELNVTEEAAMEIAKEALEIAAISLEAINLDSIIEFSVQTSLDVLKDIELEVIIQEALEGIEIEFDSDSNANLDELENELDELENMK